MELIKYIPKKVRTLNKSLASFNAFAQYVSNTCIFNHQHYHDFSLPIVSRNP